LNILLPKDGTDITFLVPIHIYPATNLRGTFLYSITTEFQVFIADTPLFMIRESVVKSAKSAVIFATFVQAGAGMTTKNSKPCPFNYIQSRL